jgi:hypothetical protein
VARDRNRTQAQGDEAAVSDQTGSTPENGDNGTTPAPDGAAPAAVAVATRKKDDLPEGFVTPVGLANHINATNGTKGTPNELKPQIVYGWIKNNKDMKALVSTHTDGRNIVNLESAMEVVAKMDAARIERANAKAAKEAAAAAAASAAPAPTEPAAAK